MKTLSQFKIHVCAEGCEGIWVRLCRVPTGASDHEHKAKGSSHMGINKLELMSFVPLF